MKKLFTICLFFVTITTQAQTFENSYPLSINWTTVSSTEFVYYKYDKLERQLTIYNHLHALIKTINVNLSDTTLNDYFLSKTLFNTDNNFEFILEGFDNFYIIGEDGNVIFQKSISDMYFQSSIVNTMNGTKLILSSFSPYQSSVNDKREVYALEGTFFGISDKKLEYENIIAYPNPAKDFVKIDYSLPNGINKGTLKLFNLNGQQVGNYQIGNDFNDIIIDTNKYKKGLYIYQVEAENYTSEAKKLVIE